MNLHELKCFCGKGNETVYGKKKNVNYLIVTRSLVLFFNGCYSYEITMIFFKEPTDYN